MNIVILQLFEMVDTSFFAHPHDERPVTRLVNIYWLNIKRGKKLGFQLPIGNLLSKKFLYKYFAFSPCLGQLLH